MASFLFETTLVLFETALFLFCIGSTLFEIGNYLFSMATIAIQTGSTTVDPYGMAGDFNAPAQTAKKSIAPSAKPKIEGKRVKEKRVM